MKHILMMFIILICSAKSLYASECLQVHLEEAIAINEKRADKYERIAGRRARVISELLIFSEKLSLNTYAGHFDERATEKAIHGKAVGCDEFVSMANVPKYSDYYVSPRPNRSSFVRIAIREYSQFVTNRLVTMDFKSVQDETNIILNTLSAELRVNCMLRHFLESILRAAHLAPKYASKEEHDLSVELISQHLIGLHFANYLDTLALRLQVQGVPILCQDVPKIEPGAGL